MSLKNLKPLILQSYLTIKIRRLDPIFIQITKQIDPPPEDLVPQFQLIRDATEAFGFLAIDKKGYEADDIIATLAKNATEEGAIVTIFSSDKDLMQLVSDDIKMYDPIRNIFIDIDRVQEKFGVTPDKVIDVQALIGDKVDNVPGVPGVGIKTASSLIAEFKTVENL